jgi:hypothetical protein
MASAALLLMGAVAPHASVVFVRVLVSRGSFAKVADTTVDIHQAEHPVVLVKSASCGTVTRHKLSSLTKVAQPFASPVCTMSVQ